MRIPVAKEGILYGIILFTPGIIFLFAQFWILSSIFGFLALAMIWFFRYPARSTEGNPFSIYAPADGRIVDIRDEYEDIFFKEIVHKIGIFMSIFNVHINYAPINGLVECIEYTRGRFDRADIVGSKESNENNFIGIRNDSLKVGVRQVAGWIARRIVCDCKIGDRVSCGERFGLIKFGSRVDVYFPGDYSICVKPGESVRAGRAVLGRK